MIAMVLVGACLGVVIFILLWEVLPRRTSPLVQLGMFDRDQSSHAGTGTRTGAAAYPGAGRNQLSLSALQAELGVQLGGWLARRGIRSTSLRQDLALTGRTFEDVLGRKILSFVAGFVVVSAGGAAVQSAAGAQVPFAGTGALGVLAGVGLFFVPDLEARSEAGARRRDFRRALGSYLDLVALEMAGAAAPAEALPSAARVGTGWPFVLIRETLRRATVSGQDHWEALSDLGRRVGVGELIDLGTLIRQVRRNGGSVRDTLTARAATMRRRELADAEGQAGKRNQSMRLAQILIGFGFVIFILFPALMNVMAL